MSQETNLDNVDDDMDFDDWDEPGPLVRLNISERAKTIIVIISIMVISGLAILFSYMLAAYFMGPDSKATVSHIDGR